MGFPDQQKSWPVPLNVEFPAAAWVNVLSLMMTIDDDDDNDKLIYGDVTVSVSFIQPPDPSTGNNNNNNLTIIYCS